MLPKSYRVGYHNEIIILVTPLYKLLDEKTMNKTPVEFIFLAFGEKTQYHSQLVYSMISIAAHMPDDRDYSFTIVTDKTDFYQWLGAQFNVVGVDENTLQKWRGDVDFFWRIKIKAILSIAEVKPEHHCVYLDTDTIADKSLTDMMKELDGGNNLMHIREFDFHSPLGRTGKKMQSHGIGKTYGEFDMTLDSAMWNAGVAAISKLRNPSKVLSSALVTCDAMCQEGMERRLVEQFSLSLALQSTSISEAKNWIRHYWGNKPQWDALISSFFAKVLLQGQNFDEAVEMFKTQRHEILDVIKDNKLQKFKNSVSKRYKRLTGIN